MTDIKRLMELEAKATKGPWIVTIGVDALVACGDGRSFNFGDAIYHDDNHANARLSAELRNSLPALLDEWEAARKVVEAAKDAVSACHLRTHGFPEGDISDLDHSKLLPAIVALDAALSAHAAAGKKESTHD